MNWQDILKNFKMADWTEEEISRLKGLGGELGLKVEGPLFRAERSHDAKAIEFSTDEIKGSIVKRGKDERSIKETMGDIVDSTHHVPTSIIYVVVIGWQKNIEGINMNWEERRKTYLTEGVKGAVQRKTFDYLGESIDYIRDSVKLRMEMLK